MQAVLLLETPDVTAEEGEESKITSPMRKKEGHGGWGKNAMLLRVQGLEEGGKDSFPSTLWGNKKYLRKPHRSGTSSGM